MNFLTLNQQECELTDKHLQINECMDMYVWSGKATCFLSVCRGLHFRGNGILVPLHFPVRGMRTSQRRG